MKQPKPIVPPFAVLPRTNANGVTVLAVVGDLDFYTVRGLRWHLLQLESTPSTLIVLDLSAMSFIDSCGVSLLIFGSKRLTAAGSELKLAALSRWTSDVLNRLGVLKLFDVFDSVEQAVSSSTDQLKSDPDLREMSPNLRSA